MKTAPICVEKSLHQTGRLANMKGHMMLIRILVILVLLAPSLALAGGKISERSAATTPLTGTETVGVIQGGADRKATVADFMKGTVTASEYGLVDSTTIDQTTLFQAFLNDNSARTKLIDVHHIKYTTAMTLPADGVHLIGVGSGGTFETYLIPTDCAAFLLTNGTHHNELSNFMIWPQGSSPPTTIITMSNTYSNHLHDIRIHVGSTYVPSTAVVSLQYSGGGVNAITFDNFIIRSDGTNFPVAFLFGANFGTVSITNSDIETAGNAMEWLGGHVYVANTYMERVGGSRGLNLKPSTDANASFTWLGGEIQGDLAGVPIAIDAGAKNVRILGPYVIQPGGTPFQVFVYSMTGNSNIVIDIANFDTAGVGSVVTLDPGLIKFVTPREIYNETVTYSASMTPTFTLGTRLSTATMTATNNTAFTVNVPSETLNRYVKPGVGAQMTLVIRNTSGGALGVATWAAGYKMGAAWTQPANAFSRSIQFQYNGTNWVEVSRSAADVAN